jgi:hypothetical protein
MQWFGSRKSRTIKMLGASCANLNSCSALRTRKAVDRYGNSVLQDMEPNMPPL